MTTTAETQLMPVIRIPARDGPLSVSLILAQRRAVAEASSAVRIRWSLLPQTQMKLGMTLENGRCACGYQRILIKQQVYAIFYPVRSAEGRAFPVNEVARKINSHLFKDDQLWRGDLVIVKFSDEYTSHPIPACFADFALIKSWLHQYPSPQPAPDRAQEHNSSNHTPLGTASAAPMELPFLYETGLFV